MEIEEDLCYIVRRLQEEYEQVGLYKNFNKCEYLADGKNGCGSLSLENSNIKNITMCDYK